MRKIAFRKIKAILQYSFCWLMVFLLSASPLLALNDTTKPWTFSAATAADYTYDTNLVAVDAGGAHPVTGANKLINPAFVSDNSSWSVATANIPSGWVLVPGSSTYSTTDFLVAKYETKCATTADPTVGLTSPDTTYHTYSNSTTACSGARAPVVLASGYPIANISQTESAAMCQSLILNTTTGNTTHLITNNEWMTIARNAELVGTNWFGGTVGANFLFSGHNDETLGGGNYYALVASTDDNPYSGTGDSTTACDNHYNNFVIGDETTSGRACVGQKRTQTLSNGSVIWDLSGNVWEWVNKSITCSADACTSAEMPYGSTPGEEWVEYASGATGWAGDVLATYGSLTWNDMGPLTATYNSNQSIGRLYTDNTIANPSGRVHAFVRGGGWDSGGQRRSLYTRSEVCA